MGLASKIQASGRPAVGMAQSLQQQPQVSSYGQQGSTQPVHQANPPYPVQQQSGPNGQSQYGVSNAPNMNANTKPASNQSYTANQGSSNPFVPGAPQAPYGSTTPQSVYGVSQTQHQGAGYGHAPQGANNTFQQTPQSNNYSQAAPMQQQAQQQPSTGFGAGNSGSIIRDNLTRIVRENQIEGFYPPQKLQQVVSRVENINFQSLSAAWDIPMEIATDLAALALYDVVFYCDDSGSMRAEERGERIDDLKLILSRVSEVATMFDDDGISIRFMNSDVQGNGIRNAQQAQQLVEQVRFSGITPLGTNLDRKVIQPLVIQPIRSRSLQKPVLVCVITDGEPVGEPRDLTRRVIAGSVQQAAQSGVTGAIRFQFAQVGKDMKAQAFLGELDNDRQLGGYIDATSYFELEAMEMEKKGVTLTPDLWLVKLCVGAIDKSYDEQDE